MAICDLLRPQVADRNLSSTELEPGNAPGAFLQTTAPVLDKHFGPMGARFLSSTGLQFATLIESAQLLLAPALDKNRSPTKMHDVLVIENRLRMTMFSAIETVTVSGSTPTLWSGPFRDHGLRPWSQSPSRPRKPQE